VRTGFVLSDADLATFGPPSLKGANVTLVSEEDNAKLGQHV
jgi:hypothetical protein